ncbi:cysteine-rich receptor-like protein kinase, partial [Trifolium pratense]
MLEDVFVPKKRNKCGQPFGLVKFSNVRDITKLLRALNNVYFGHYCVRARVASFDRNDVTASQRMETERLGLTKGNVKPAMKECFDTDPRTVNLNGNDIRIKSMGPQAKKGVGRDAGPVKGGSGDPGAVRVGDIDVSLGARKEKVTRHNDQVHEGGHIPSISALTKAAIEEKDRQVLMRSYRTEPDNVSRAQNGIVATIINGEAVLVVQSRIMDACFNDVVLIPMGAGKLQAWNANFFKLCVDDCGRFLRLDNCSVDKDRVDFARVLIATPDLEIVNKVETVLVDGTQIEGDPEVRHHIDTMVENFAKGMEEDDEIGCRALLGASPGKRILLFRRENRVAFRFARQLTIVGALPVTESMLGHLRLKIVINVQNPIHQRNGGDHKKSGQEDPKRRKGGGVFRHSLSSLKKVARMPSTDLVEVLKVLKKNERRRRVGEGVTRACGVSQQVPSTVSSSTASATNDLRHWVVMQGVCSLGRVKHKRRRRGRHWEETKLQACDDFTCSSLWGNSPHVFSYRPSVGASGGLLTLWDSSEVEVWTSESYENVLWCHGRFIRYGEEFYLANVYAPCDPGAKQVLWDSLSVKIQALGSSRVCVCGDFNAIRSIDERCSVRDGYRSSDHIPFNRFIDDNTLIDLPLCGRKFTWFKGDGRSMNRLDRFLLSDEWCLTWPNCTQVARMIGLSDHCPLVLAVDEEDWGPRPSRMLKCWKDVPGYNRFVREKWNSFQFDGWANLPSRIESLKDKFAALDEKGGKEVLSNSELAEFHGVSSDIHSLSRLNASICWQQSRSRWLKEGDANTKYFHSVIASRQRGNAISSLYVDNTVVEGVVPIRHAIVSHFASHFKAVNVERPEVKAAVWDYDSYKSPGLDGINFGFIKDFWAEMQGDIMRFISEFQRNGRLTKGLNATFIALIPKVDSPQRSNDFRPISLVGSLYKILAKMLANRLRLVIGSVISASQTAFVKGWQILDDILIANEVVDEARKAKNEVDWGYLDTVMGRMGFSTLWGKWIKECVCTATTSVLVNGSLTDEFPLERGLRQEDSLSPFLFLLAAEGLHVLMEAMVERNLFTGYSVGELAVTQVSHLQFADHTLLMGTKRWANVRAMRTVLVLLESMSGLQVNFHKSMLVGVNIPDSWLGEAASALCCNVGKIPFLYLGLSIGGDPRRLCFWEPVLDRLKHRLSGWRSRFLSFGGRLVLLKSVLTSLSVYALSFFKAPL